MSRISKSFVVFMLLACLVFSQDELEYHTGIAKCALGIVDPIFTVIHERNITFDEVTPQGQKTLDALHVAAASRNRQQFIDVGLLFVREVQLLAHQFNHLKHEDTYKDLGDAKAEISTNVDAVDHTYGSCIADASRRLNALHIERIQKWEQSAQGRIDYLSSHGYPTNEMKTRLLEMQSMRTQFVSGQLSRSELREVKKRAWVLFELADMESLLKGYGVKNEEVFARIARVREDVLSEDEHYLAYYQQELQSVREQVMGEIQ